MKLDSFRPMPELDFRPAALEVVSEAAQTLADCAALMPEFAKDLRNGALGPKTYALHEAVVAQKMKAACFLLDQWRAGEEFDVYQLAKMMATVPVPENTWE